jgi:hypothetical protein
MRVMTKAGQYINLSDSLVVHQEKMVTKTETYYVVHLSDGRKLSITTPVPRIKSVTVDVRNAKLDD